MHCLAGGGLAAAAVAGEDAGEEGEVVSAHPQLLVVRRSLDRRCFRTMHYQVAAVAEVALGTVLGHH